MSPCKKNSPLPPPPTRRHSCATDAEAERHFFSPQLQRRAYAARLRVRDGRCCSICALTRSTRLIAGLGPPYGRTEPIGRQGYYRTGIFWPWHAGLANLIFDKGEIDILEGVNDQGSDLVSLHTTPGTHFCSRGVRSPDSAAERLLHAGVTCYDWVSIVINRR